MQTRDLKKLRRLAKDWNQRRILAKLYALNPPHKRQWFCLYSHERDPRQGWRTNTGNGYFGGLQMDKTFQRMYGYRLYVTKGTADNWTWYEQMWVGEMALRAGRGWYPWPNTARMCGLL
jgi:hypothetical protein